MPKKSVGCHVETTLRVIDGRWRVMILHELFPGTKRFGELRRALAGITHRTLTQNLRDLESLGIVSRTVHAVVPPHVDYALTPLGKSLKPILEAMHSWGEVQGRRLPKRPPAA